MLHARPGQQSHWISSYPALYGKYKSAGGLLVELLLEGVCFTLETCGRLSSARCAPGKAKAKILSVGVVA